MKQHLPKVVEVHSQLSALGCRRYRISGGDIAPDWAEACSERGEEPQCEVTIWGGGDQLGSYGGTVWPSAWPELFESHRGSAQSGPFTLLTDLGKRMIAEADPATGL